MVRATVMSGGKSITPHSGSSCTVLPAATAAGQPVHADTEVSVTPSYVPSQRFPTGQNQPCAYVV